MTHNFLETLFKPASVCFFALLIPSFLAPSAFAIVKCGVKLADGRDMGCPDGTECSFPNSRAAVDCRCVKGTAYFGLCRAILVDPVQGASHTLPQERRGRVTQDAAWQGYAKEDAPAAADKEKQAIAVSHYKNGLAYYAKGEYSAAILDFNKAVSLDPNLDERISPKLAGSYFARGMNYFKKEEYPKAVADYKEALKLKPDFTNAQEALALARKKQAEYKPEADQAPADAQNAGKVPSGIGLAPAVQAVGGGDPKNFYTRRDIYGNEISRQAHEVVAQILGALAVIIGVVAFIFLRRLQKSDRPINKREIAPAPLPAAAKAFDGVLKKLFANSKAVRFESRVSELMAAGDYNKALAAYASRNHSHITGADKVNLFEIHLRLGNHDRARLVFEDIKGNKLLAEDLPRYKDLADLCYSGNQLDLGRAVCGCLFLAMKEKLTLQNDPVSFYELALSCESKGDFELARNIYGFFLSWHGMEKYKDVAARYEVLKVKPAAATPQVRQFVPAPSAIKTGAAAAGQVLGGRYELRGNLGEGAMGVVYEAWDWQKGEQVAVKRMHAYLKEYPAEYGRFRKEAEIVGRLKHPNIVCIHELLEQGGEIYLVFDYVAGKTLYDVLKEKKRFKLLECKDIFNGVCDAVHYAHKNNVIHRDLKPANIMLAGPARAMVMDFGLASELRDGLTRVTHQTMSGTPAFMAPEQHAGTVKRESDIYAMGVCLYEMVTGVLPFEGFDTEKQKKLKDYREATSIVSWLPTGVDEVISRALEPEPSMRFADALDFWDAMKDL